VFVLHCIASHCVALHCMSLHCFAWNPDETYQYIGNTMVVPMCLVKHIITCWCCVVIIMKMQMAIDAKTIEFVLQLAHQGVRVLYDVRKKRHQFTTSFERRFPNQAQVTTTLKAQDTRLGLEEPGRGIGALRHRCLRDSKNSFSPSFI
jgi:hypothetical protein